MLLPVLCVIQKESHTFAAAKVSAQTEPEGLIHYPQLFPGSILPTGSGNAAKSISDTPHSSREPGESGRGRKAGVIALSI